MKITHFGHACVLVELKTPEPTRILIDPGSYSRDFESVEDVDGVLFTHSHPDHIDMTRVPGLLSASVEVTVAADHASARILSEHTIEHQTTGLPVLDDCS